MQVHVSFHLGYNGHRLDYCGSRTTFPTIPFGRLLRRRGFKSTSANTAQCSRPPWLPPFMAPIFPRLKPESFAGPQDPCDLCHPCPHPDSAPAAWASLLTLKSAGVLLPLVSSLVVLTAWSTLPRYTPG